MNELLSIGNAFQKMKDKDENGNKNTIEGVVKKMENKLNYQIYDLKKYKQLNE